MNDNSTGNSLVTIVILLSVILLIKLGSNEVQPWDEGLYAIRAQSILHFSDALLDQSDYSLGGLYSGTYPPLSVWAIAASMSLFGENEFSIRLFSALCSISSLILISLIAKRFTDNDNWIAVAALLFVSLAWNTYSRQGMTDVPLITFFLLCFYSVIKGIESESKAEIIAWAFVFMLGFSCALMTKIIKSLLPLVFILILFLRKGFSNQKTFFVIFSFLGLFIGSLWYIYMALEHGSAFTNALLVPHIYSVVEGNTKNLGLFYYFNQLIISNPLFLFTLGFIIIMIFKRRFILYQNPIKDYIYIASLVWFIGVFIIFSLSVTKLYHYTAYLLPSLALLSAIAYEKQETIIRNPSIRLFLYLSLLATLAWSISFELRQEIRLVASGEFSSLVIIFMALLFIILIVTVFAAKTNYSGRLSQSLEWRLPVIILGILFFRIVFINSAIDVGYSHGAKAISASLSKFQSKGFIYLYHRFTSADSLNPQLAWYSGDYIRGWTKQKEYKPVGLNGNTFDIKSLREIDKYPEYPLIYYISDDRELSEKIIKDIMETRNPVRLENNYVLFGMKRYDRSKRITI
jgi:4-amino-4-deoxy-L-arabinose transferase-like glycosyltransferase